MRAWVPLCVIAALFLVQAWRDAALDVDSTIEFAKRPFKPGQSCHGVELPGVAAEPCPQTDHVDIPREDEGEKTRAFCMARYKEKNVWYYPAVFRKVVTNFAAALGIHSPADLLWTIPVALLLGLVVFAAWRARGTIDFFMPAWWAAEVAKPVDTAFVDIDGRAGRKTV